MAAITRARESVVMQRTMFSPLNRPVIAQSEVTDVISPAATLLLRIARHWARPPVPSRPMAEMFLLHQSREGDPRPAPGAKSPLSPSPAG
jgi:hypothetical protein